ncbi:MFS transporter [Lentzea sp. NBRC 105346]|uniref:MFS transporter n=1 Tax=Lentzea sp. NBRC 105346 TaxID=3032205 RepID=UPI0024A450B7|nr:MFS transporter [Lentzea sp. NBRC 105346]GLZ30946.1 MFS transporter [Lentzea sp. NBRC 105346]
MKTDLDAPRAGTGTYPCRRQRVRTIISTGAGNALEWFDWNIYALFAPLIATQFFNPQNSFSALLSTLAVFAVGFVMRPLGGFLFGWFADRHGRRASLLLSIILGSAGSLLIGVAPSYATAGVAASVVLLVARLLQGLAYGGEASASYTYISESAPSHRRGLWSSTIYVSGVAAILFGTLLGATLTSALTRQDMAAWGWRVPFLIGGVLGIITLFLRRKLSETRQYEQAQAQERTVSLARGLWENRGAALRVIGLVVGVTAFFYLWVVAAPAYAISVLHMDPSAALWSGVISSSVMIAVIPLAGALSDRFGRRPNFLIFTLGAAALSFPLNRLIQGGEMWQLTLAMSIAGVLLAVVTSILPAYLAELFPTHVRASGIGLPYSIAVGLCGGTAPYLQTWLAGTGNGDLFIGYTVVLLLLGAVVVLATPETKGRPLN